MRYLLLFLAGTASFTVIPIFAPFVVLQADELPLFYAGLLSGVAVGAALALLAGPSRGYLLMLACAITGALVYFFAFDIPKSTLDRDPLLVSISVVPVAACYSVIPASLGIACIALGKLMLSRLRR